MYVNTYFWELKSKDFDYCVVCPCGPLIAVLLVMNFQAHFEKHHALMFALVGGMFMSMVGVIARLSGLFPEYESSFFLPAITCIATINAFFALLLRLCLFP